MHKPLQSGFFSERAAYQGGKRQAPPFSRDTALVLSAVAARIAVTKRHLIRPATRWISPRFPKPLAPIAGLHCTPEAPYNDAGAVLVLRNVIWIAACFSP
jgi:hypothetical protein